MRILTRYVLGQVLKVFGFSLTAMTLLFLIGGVAREAVNQNLPPTQIVRLVPFLLPEMLRITVPVTLLLATTLVYSRMSGASEVVAIKSLGISPMTILWPTMILAVLMSLLTVWLNDLAVSWGRNGMRRVVVGAVEEIAYAMLRTQKQYTAPGIAISVKEVRGRRLILPTLTVKQGDSAFTFRAQEAELSTDRQADLLRVEIQNYTVEYAGKVEARNPGVFKLEYPLAAVSRAHRDSRVPSEMPLRVIGRETASQIAQIERVEQEMAARAAYQMLCGDFEELTSREWETRRLALAGMNENLHRLQTEPYRRWSAGFSCLFFVLVGAPMAIRLRHREFLAPFALSFFPILIVYYPLLAFGIDGAKSGTIPPVSVWTGNVLLAAWGAERLYKVIRY